VTQNTLKDDEFLKQAKRVLDDDVATLDPLIAQRLQVARRQALDGATRRHTRGMPQWLSSTVAASVLVAMAWMLIPREADLKTGMEDLELLSSAEDLEFYENLEFYQWLDAQPSEAG